MSATEAAHEIRQKFGLDDELTTTTTTINSSRCCTSSNHGTCTIPPAGAIMECTCDLRAAMSTLDFDLFGGFDHDLSTDEYDLVDFDQQPSVDDLVKFIDGTGANPLKGRQQQQQRTQNGLHPHLPHTSLAFLPCVVHDMCTHEDNDDDFDDDDVDVDDNDEDEVEKDKEEIASSHNLTTKKKK
jgi:hypothetical protein